MNYSDNYVSVTEELATKELCTCNHDFL